MKRVLLACAAAIALVVGVNSKAEAAVSTHLHICQGATCVDFFNGPAVDTPLGIIVGDYQLLSAGGATIEGADFSQSQTTTLQVRRIGSTSAAPLEVWLQATDYMLPNGPSFVVDTTLGATSSPTNPGAIIDYMAWLSTINGTGFPPAGSVPTGLIACSPVAPSGPGACAVTGNPTLVSPGAVPFSLTTRTRFNIGIGNTLIYGSTGQAIVTAVPEPMSLLLIGSGLLGLGATRRRLKK